MTPTEIVLPKCGLTLTWVPHYDSWVAVLGGVLALDYYEGHDIFRARIIESSSDPSCASREEALAWLDDRVLALRAALTPAQPSVDPGELQAEKDASTHDASKQRYILVDALGRICGLTGHRGVRLVFDTRALAETFLSNPNMEPAEGIRVVPVLAALAAAAGGGR